MSEQSSRQNSNLQQTHGSKVVAQVQLRPATEIACSERWRTVGLLFPFPAITPKCVSACCPPHDWRPHRTVPNEVRCPPGMMLSERCKSPMSSSFDECFLGIRKVRKMKLSHDAT